MGSIMTPALQLHVNLPQLRILKFRLERVEADVTGWKAVPLLWLKNIFEHYIRVTDHTDGGFKLDEHRLVWQGRA